VLCGCTFQSNRSTRQEFSLNLSVCSPVEGSVFNQSHVSPFSLVSVIADGVDEVRKVAREELRKKAAQIKAFASSVVVFPSDAHSTLYEYSQPELQAIAEESLT
jgi:imidazolonepropionase-like amidohydrolase